MEQYMLKRAYANDIKFDQSYYSKTTHEKMNFFIEVFKSYASMIKEYCEKIGINYKLTEKMLDINLYESKLLINNQEKTQGEGNNKKKAREAACQKYVEFVLNNENSEDEQNHENDLDSNLQKCYMDIFNNISKLEKYDPRFNYGSQLNIYSRYYKYQTPKYDVQFKGLENYECTCTMIAKKVVGVGNCTKSAKNHAAFVMINQIQADGVLVKPISRNSRLLKSDVKQKDSIIQQKDDQLDITEYKNDNIMKKIKIDEHSREFFDDIPKFKEDSSRYIQEQNIKQMYQINQDTLIKQSQNKSQMYIVLQQTQNINDVLDKHIDKNLFSKEELNQNNLLNEKLLTFSKNNSIPQEIYEQINRTIDTLSANKEIFSKIGFVGIKVVGSLFYKILAKDNLVGDLILSCNPENNQLTDSLIKQEVFRGVHSLFPMSYIQQYHNYISIKESFIEIRIYIDCLRNGIYTMDSHHWSYMQKYRDMIRESLEIQSLFVAVRKLKRYYLINVNIAILDALILWVTKEFNYVNPQCNFIELLNILAFYAQETNVLSSYLIHFTELHKRIINENKKELNILSQVCQSILTESRFDFL